MRVIAIAAAIVIALIALGWLGLRVKPAPFPAFPQQTPALETVPLPDGLPAPVDRFYRQLYGDDVPLITSAVITGRASMRPAGPLALPSRFRFTHTAGQDYRHYIESTFFGLTLFQVNEHYLDGSSLLKLPFGITDQGPKVDAAANLGLWAEEAAWLPSMLVTDPRVRWEPVDGETAVLVVPFGEEEQRFVVRFDPDTGMLHMLESMRFHGSSSPSKVLWLNEARDWGSVSGQPLAARSSATWMDDGKPWAIFTVEDIAYNVDVEDTIRADKDPSRGSNRPGTGHW